MVTTKNKTMKQIRFKHEFDRNKARYIDVPFGYKMNMYNKFLIR